jgi:hypothetical protein
MVKLLVVSHAPSPATQILLSAVVEGASHPDIFGVTVDVRSPFDTEPEHVLGAQGILLGTTENFGYMSGALKDFFDRIYYPCLEETQAMPCALYVKGGLDGTGAERSVLGIIGGLKWKMVFEPVIMQGSLDKDWLPKLAELGMGMAAGLEAGIF